MKIKSVILAYNDEETIGAVIKCIKPFVDEIVVMLSERPYFGVPEAPDNTEEICLSLDVNVVKGYWKLDHYQRNTGKKILKDCDWIIYLDSDELIDNKNIIYLLDFLKNTNDNAVTVLPRVYWKTIDYILDPPASFDPIIAARPHVDFHYIRNVNSSYVRWDGEMHHLSWCSPKDIKKKVTTYAHASDFDGEKWFNDRYEKWNYGDDVIMPNGEVFKTKLFPLPDDLRILL